MALSDQSPRDRGLAVEAKVAAWLEARGLSIIARNVVAAGAEIDLIARHDVDGDAVCVFIEVRSRAQTELGNPLETIDEAKRRRIIRGASGWLVEQELWERVAVRFDVVAVVGEPSDTDLEIVWLRDAFSA